MHLPFGKAKYTYKPLSTASKEALSRIRVQCTDIELNTARALADDELPLFIRSSQDGPSPYFGHRITAKAMLGAHEIAFAAERLMAHDSGENRVLKGDDAIAKFVATSVTTILDWQNHLTGYDQGEDSGIAALKQGAPLAMELQALRREANQFLEKTGQPTIGKDKRSIAG